MIQIKFIFLFCGMLLCMAASADEVHLNILGLTDKQAEKAVEIKAVKKHVEKNNLKIYGQREKANRMPSAEEVNSFFADAKVDTSNLDQLDKDMFFLALKSWKPKKVVQKFKNKIPESDIRRALQMVGR